jgi:hypothetical protein
MVAAQTSDQTRQARLARFQDTEQIFFLVCLMERLGKALDVVQQGHQLREVGAAARSQRLARDGAHRQERRRHGSLLLGNDLQRAGHGFCLSRRFCHGRPRGL